MASSCMSALGFDRELPGRSSLLRCHLLDRVADMDHDEVARRDRLILHQKQADLPFDAFGAPSSHVSVDGNHLQWGSLGTCCASGAEKAVASSLHLRFNLSKVKD